MLLNNSFHDEKPEGFPLCVFNQLKDKTLCDLDPWGLRGKKHLPAGAFPLRTLRKKLCGLCVEIIHARCVHNANEHVQQPVNR
jgi:hypothetical protein